MSVDTEWKNKVELAIRSMLSKFDNIEHKLDQLLYEEDVVDNHDFVSEDDIINKGQKVAYNKIVDQRSINEFRKFIDYVLNHEHEFTNKEYDYAKFKENNDRFSDVRLSDNHRRILGTAFAKVHGRTWEFPFIRGTMYKYNGSIAWRWTDGGID
jgi:hypothetical protein